MSGLSAENMNNTRRKFCRNKRKNKLAIVFDESARREFLTGFHKRKLQRKNKAKEEFEKQLKAERKRIKAEAKEQYMKLLLSRKAPPELTNLASQNIDMGTHSVSVTELSTAELARKNNWIGVNEVQDPQIPGQAEELTQTSGESRVEQGLEGMEVRKEGKNKLSNSSIAGKSSKEIRRKIKQHATANVRNSKIFKKKAAIEKIKNIKLRRKNERKLEKTKKVDKRSRHKNVKNNKYNI